MYDASPIEHIYGEMRIVIYELYTFKQTNSVADYIVVCVNSVRGSLAQCFVIDLILRNVKSMLFL